ncbi:ATPase [Microbacterium betulae]|uniref:ATPase n=1 Tax=Microbacterium betulae TaxID=2981139 RepID=A0AA97FIL3_9MICO|nr:ATPase [Microbacterium sp. AB]WOF22704.1 ATPase [Microbacterium sp. AB]
MNAAGTGDALILIPGDLVTDPSTPPNGEHPTASGEPAAPGRSSFLHGSARTEPAQTGWRGLLRRAGVELPPSEAELAVRADEHAVSQHWPGPRKIAVVNAKGGTGKTPATVFLSSVFARLGGVGVLAWDNNHTRGTLGWRTEQAEHDRTVLDLLPEADRLLHGDAHAADLSRYVHHQAADRFDVLRAQPVRLADEQRIETADVDVIHEIATKFYRLIVMDSGDDESDPVWRRMIDHADQLVVTTTTRSDHAESGALLLEALAQRDARSARLAERAVVVVSQADPRASAAEVERVANGYSPLARAVVRIPFDRGIVDGPLRSDRVSPRTRRAWLAAAAAVARGL